MGWKWQQLSLGISAVACALLSTSNPAMAVGAAGPPGGRPQATDKAAPDANRVNENARIMAAFVKRVEEYVALRHKLERGLPKRGDKASPEEIVGHRRAMAEGLRQARASAQPGDLFTPETQNVLRAMLASVFTKPQVGSSAKAAVNEENPRGLRVAVNAVYPDGAPLTTMPPEVLSNLPQLPEGLHYHFVGKTLILLDSDARLIVDFMANAMP